MESFLFDIIGHWTFSKLVPFLILFIASYLLTLFLLKNKSSLFKHFLAMSLSGALVIVYFSFNIVYISDIENNYRSYENDESFGLEKNQFYVLSIPGCKYCKESIPLISNYTEMSNIDSVTYLVCDSVVSTYPSYLDVVPENFGVIQGRDISRLIELADYSFPSFMFVDSANKIYVWNNNDFGTRAKDFIKKNRP